MNAIGNLLLYILHLYSLLVFFMVIMSWLWASDTVPRRNAFSVAVARIFDKLIEQPFLKKIRPYMPDIGPFDISPVVLLLAIYVLHHLIIIIFPWSPTYHAPAYYYG